MNRRVLQHRHDEILFRRIGANELDAIQICKGFVEAQKEYASEIHDDSGVNEYAQKIISTPGKRDGLYWQNPDGTPGGPISEAVARAIEEGYYRDVLIFAAAHNEHPLTRSYPAQFAPPLISVDKSTFADPLQFAYRLREQIEFQADGRGHFGPFANEPATSWAAPHLAGIAARILSLRSDLKPFEIKTILYWLSKHYEK